MPYYDFECEVGHKFEQLVAVGTKGTDCPECAKLDELVLATRVLSKTAPAAQFSGHGWTPPKLERK